MDAARAARREPGKERDMDTSKATPRPWKRGRLPDMIVADRIPADGMKSSRADSEVLAYHGGFLLGESFSDPDREFTLRAVNAHDELMAMARRLANGWGTAIEQERARALLAERDAKNPV